MNTDPQGTDEDSIDVFVLCSNSSDATQLIGQLSPHGYRVTIFTDIPQLFDNIRAEKPNLLICDAAGMEPDGYEFCQEIKTDYDLYRIPVLLISGVSGLSDLLKVLDSNADNFIARPYDLSELLPLIENMIAEPVEKPDPERVKTRFKIRHDDRDYVIMADRRKLLNFLLNSYELAVNRAQELGRVQDDFEDLKEELEIRVKNRTHALSDEVDRIETLVKEHSRTLAQKEKIIQEQEAQEKELRAQLLENQATISQETASLTKISDELGENKIRCADAEEKCRTIAREKEELARSLQEEIDALRVARDDLKTELDATKRQHSEALDQISSHEVRHADLATEKEQTETTLHSCSLELDDLKQALAAQKDRAAAADKELQSVKQAKAVSEQELKKIVNDLTGKLKEQADEFLKQKKVIEAETGRRTALGQQVQALAQEREKCEAALGAENASLREQRDALQAKFDTTTAALGAERQKAATFANDLKSACATNEKILEELQITTRRMEIAETACEEEKQLRLVSEKNAKEAITAQDEAEQSYQKLLASLHEDKKTYSEDISLANRELDTVQSIKKRLESDLSAAVLARVQSEKFAQSLSHEIEQLRSQLETERKERKGAEDTLKEERQAKDRIDQSLRTITTEKAHEHDNILVKLENLTSAFDKERARHESLEKQLAAAAKQQLEKNAAFQELTRKFEQVQAANDADKKRLRELEELLNRERQAKERAEEHLIAVTEEKTREHNNLVLLYEKLTKDFENGLLHQKSLLEQITTATQQQSKADEACQTLSKDYKELQAAFEAEKTQLKVQKEQLAKVQQELSRAQTRIQQAEKETPVIVPNHALTIKGPDLPRVVEQGKHSLTVVDDTHSPNDIVAVPADPSPPAAQVSEEISPAEIESVEDLFEDEPDMDIDELPDASGLPAPDEETAGDIPVTRPVEIPRPVKPMDELADQETVEEERQAGAGETGDSDVSAEMPDAGTSTGKISGEEEKNEKPEGEKTRTIGTLDEYGFAPAPDSRVFDHRQWFDLVRWAHNTPELSKEQKLRFVRLGRLIRNGRKLNRSQDEQVTELVSLAYSMGYKRR